MPENTSLFYTYLIDGKEYFTSNLDLAHKRADEDTEIQVTTVHGST